VAMRSGQGEYVVGFYRWPRGSRGPFGLEGTTYVRFAEVTTLLNQAGYSFDLNYDPFEGRLRRQGGEAKHQVRLERGKCYAAVVAGGGTLKGIQGQLVSADGVLGRTSSAGGPVLSLHVCSERDQQAELIIRSLRGEGPYVAQLFVRRGGEEEQLSRAR
ncbi:MAG: hypothetical protein NZM37_13060, partial [Sandaracinaceae bacterium]|nr:hypothetical protein [Sandaracinaceae bacterium]